MDPHPDQPTPAAQPPADDAQSPTQPPAADGSAPESADQQTDAPANGGWHAPGQPAAPESQLPWEQTRSHPHQQPPTAWQPPGQATGAAAGQPPYQQPGQAPYQPPGQPHAQQQAGQPGGPVPGQPGFWSPEQPPPWGAPQAPPGTQQPPLYGTPPPPPYGGQQPAPYGGTPPPPYGPPQQSPYGAPPQPYPQQPPPYGYPQYGQPYAPREPQVVEAPPGTPYHRLARTAKHRWWRPLLSGLSLVAGAIIVTTGVVIVWEIVHALITGEFSEPEGNDFFPSDLENLSLTLVMLAVLTPVVLFSVRFVQRRPALSIASVLNKIRWRWLLLSCLPAAGYLLLNYSLNIALEALFPADDTILADEGAWVGFAGFIGPALLILLLVPFQSAAEEFVFRGWVIQAIGAYGPDTTTGSRFVQRLKQVLRSPWPALVISAVLFFLAHGYTGWARLDIFLFAMTIGWLTLRTGGLESAISLHALNNIVAFMLPAATGQLSGWDEQGGAPWTLVAIDVPCLALYAVAVVWLAKRKEVARFSRAE